MRDIWIEPKPLKDAASVAEALATSPMMGRSTLNRAFEASRGFAFTFRRDGLAELLQRYPFLWTVLGRFTHRRVRRALGAGVITRLPNAFYLNVLVVPPGASVGRHVDATLRGPTGVPGLLPRWVSVAHLRVPAHSGGELELFRGERPVALLEARAGRVLHFRGDLHHGVRPVRGDSPRLSLVCEQYRVPRGALRRLPRVRSHSRAGFHALVDHGLATS